MKTGKNPMFGWVRIRYTSADSEARLRLLAERCRVFDVNVVSALVTEFTVSLWDWPAVCAQAKKHDDGVHLIARGGVIPWLDSMRSVPVICMTICLVIFATIWIPSRIFFIRVEGNQAVPSRLILEAAERCGLYFGCNRGLLRSEQIKNRLLDEIPDLRWVGVNTQGCVATISVQERQVQPKEDSATPGNIVAAIDAIVTECTVLAGDSKCKPGDAVKAGQILISGYTDLDRCTHVQAAQGDVYGLTVRKIRTVLPHETLVPDGEGQYFKKYSMIFGKKRINFYSDSGILYAGCGKMTQIRYLQLPGGWTLPVAFVVEIYNHRDLLPTTRWEQEARENLSRCGKTRVLNATIAGQILREEMTFTSEDGVYALNARYECREMIGRRSSGIQIEGDTKDDGKNCER